MKKHLLTLLAAPAMTASVFASENKPLQIGDRMPAVVAPDQDGKPVHFAKVATKGLVMVYFYPKADTPGCTAQGCSLRDDWAELSKRGVTVYGVSVDAPAAQKAFKAKYGLPFTLIADEDKVVTKAFQTSGLQLAVGFAKRQAYLFEDGVCIYADHKGHTSDQARLVVEFLDSRKR